MVCSNCENDLIFPQRTYLDLIEYQERGTIIVASVCCGAGYLVKKK
jgi:hypothetical protein